MAVVLGFSGIPNGDEYLRRYGLRFVGHDAAAALVVDGRLAFAAEEERFSRAKHTSRLPSNAVCAAVVPADGPRRARGRAVDRESGVVGPPA